MFYFPHSAGALAQPFRYASFLAIFIIGKAIAKIRLQGQKYYQNRPGEGWPQPSVPPLEGRKFL